MTTLHTHTVHIANAVDILRFQHEAAAIREAVSHAFFRHADEQLLQLQQAIHAANPDTANALSEALQAFDAANLDRRYALYTPEVIHRLIFSGKQYYLPTASFIIKSIDAALAMHNQQYDTSRYTNLWTSNGSGFIAWNEEAQDYTVFESCRLNEEIPLDFFSPYCAGISKEELNEPAENEVLLYDFDEAAELYDTLEQAAAALSTTSAAWQHIKHFTNVIALKKIVSPHSTSFISSTSDYLIGRTLLLNAETVSSEDIADALVHESTHTLLNMIEVLQPWQPQAGISSDAGYSIISPWSGNMLTVRNYMQANFVWFGLFQFWLTNRHSSLFENAYVEKRLRFIRNGFENQKIEILQQFGVGNDVLDVFRQTREQVLSV